MAHVHPGSRVMAVAMAADLSSLAVTTRHVSLGYRVVTPPEAQFADHVPRDMLGTGRAVGAAPCRPDPRAGTSPAFRGSDVMMDPMESCVEPARQVSVCHFVF